MPPLPAKGWSISSASGRMGAGLVQKGRGNGSGYSNISEVRQMSLTVEVQTIPLRADNLGVMRVGDTRVTLDTVVRSFEQGHTAEEIISHFPALRLADVYAVIAYYLNHQGEVRLYLQQQKMAAEKMWQQIEAESDYQGFRQRLLARHQLQTGSATP